MVPRWNHIPPEQKATPISRRTHHKSVSHPVKSGRRTPRLIYDRR